MVSLGGWRDPTELVKPGEGHRDGGEGEVGRLVGAVPQRVAVRLLRQAPHLLLHLQTLVEKLFISDSLHNSLVK